MSIARTLAISAGIAALVTAFAVHGSGLAAPDTKAIIAACASCHGASGEGNEARSAPRLAGLQADYMTRQLAAYGSRERGAHRADPFGSQMVVIGQPLTAADRAAISQHYSRMVAADPVATVKADSRNGRRLYESCSACHGADGMGLAETNAPRLAGQADWYIQRSLEHYRSGARGGNAADANGQVMAAAAQVLTTSTEIRDVSAYASGLGRR